MDILLLFIYTVRLEGDRAVTQVSGRHDSRTENQKQSNDLGNRGHGNWMELAQQRGELSRLQDAGAPKRCPFWVERLCLPARGGVRDAWASPAWFSAERLQSHITKCVDHSVTASPLPQPTVKITQKLLPDKKSKKTKNLTNLINKT